jgi:3-hydroxyisobutyrate dehydrogenase
MANSFTPPASVGFVGLGNMGAPMARRLAAAGYSLVVTDANPAAVSALAADTRCQAATDLASLGAACRAVITMLPDGNIVRDVVLGKNGIAAGMEAGAVVIDMSSSSPIGTRELGAALAAQHMELVDAPVSGGVQRARDGKLSIMVGGNAPAVERCRPILEVMGRVFLTGGPGTGHAMKAINNYLSAASLASAAEGIIAGTRFGLTPETMIDILNSSSGRSYSTEYKYPDFILPGTFDTGFALRLMAKDVRLALELAQGEGSPHVLLRAVSELWSRAEQKLDPRADHTEVVKYLQSLAGETVND